MGSLFSNPGKQAQQGTSGLQDVISSEIGQAQSYNQQQEALLRGAVRGMPLNPYNDVAFGNLGPGLTSGSQTFTPGSAAPSFSQTPPKPPAGGISTRGGQTSNEQPLANRRPREA